MVKKSAEMAFTSKRLNSSKWLLLLCAASAAAVDLAVIIMLFLGGTVGGYLACPFVLLIFDVLFFIISLFFTNFRFKYSLGVWIGYVLFSAIALAAGTALLLGGNGSVITNASFWLWAAVHIFGLLCAVFTALHASRIIKNLWVTLAVAAVFVFGCISYCAYMADAGFFGQGVECRPIVFTYNSKTGEYTATDVLPGKSKRVEVPRSFNGKPVTALSFNLLLNSGIREYTFASDLQFTGEQALEKATDIGEKTLKVEKEAVNSLREKLYSYTGAGNTQANAIALANATLPATLGEGEGYVAFTYGLQEFNACGGQVIPIYIGDLSQFDFASHTAGFDYVLNRDRNNAEHLDWSFKHGGYIFSDIKGENGSVAGGVTQSTVAKVEFEKIYRVTVESGNDKKYDEREIQPDFCFDTVGGSRLDYRYVTLDRASTFTDGLNARKGFTLEWAYYDQNGKRVLKDLKETLENLDGTDITLAAVWRLNNPVVSVSAVNGGNYVYGDDVSILTEASIEAEGVPLEYRWTYADSSIVGWTTADLNFAHPKPDRSGVYNLVVHNGESEVTSLGAVASATVQINISKKPVEFVWEAPQDLVYDSQEKVAVANFDQSQIVSGDEFRYSVALGGGIYDGVADGNRFICVKANTYTLSVGISGADADCYDAGNTTDFSFTVAKRPITAEWSGYEGLVYSGIPQGPKASAIGLGGDGELISTVTGLNTGAVTGATATAVLNNSNYTLENPTQVYTIAPKRLVVTPSMVTATYGYAPDTSGITLNYNGFVNGETSSVLGGSRKFTFTPALGASGYAAGTYAEGVAVSGLTSNNYDIQFEQSTYKINPRIAEIQWSGHTGLVYDATAKNVTASVSNLYGNDVYVEVTVDGGNAVEAGTHKASAVRLDGGGSSNYVLPASPAECEYTISPAEISIVPQAKSAVYGESEKPLTATVQGVIYNGEVEYELTRESGNTAGTYEINVNVTKQSSNYNISKSVAVYEIIRRTATVSWSGYSNLVYNGSAISVAAEITNAVAGDDVSVVVKNGTNTNAGSYVAVAEGLAGSAASNYTLPAGITRSYTIEKAAVKITADNKTSVYGEKLEELTATVQGNIYSNGLEYRLERQSANRALDVFVFAGRYAIVCTVVKNDGNYAVETVNGEYVIEKRHVTVTWSGYENLVYDGAEKTVTASADNVVAADTPYVEVTGNKATDAGEYTAKFTFTGGYGNNYTLSGETLVYNIKQAESDLVLTFNGKNLSGETAITASVGEELFLTCNATLKYSVNGGNVRVEDGEQYVFGFEEAGSFVLTFTVGDKNHKTITRTLTVTVEEAETVPDGGEENV